MKKIALLAGLVTTALVGCGGGGGGSNTTTAAQASAFNGDGIYVNQADLAVMLIDSTRSRNNLAVGDFANNRVYFVDSATTSGNTMKTTGITLVNSNTFAKDSKQQMTASVKNNAITLTATVSGQNLVYSMDKTSDSLSLSEIIGTHTNPTDGSTWKINADSSFAVNGICTISGKLVRKGAYFNITGAKATGCNKPSLNGTYNGVLLTVAHKGKRHIAGLLGNDTGILWGSAPKS